MKLLIHLSLTCGESNGYFELNLNNRTYSSPAYRVPSGPTICILHLRRETMSLEEIQWTTCTAHNQYQWQGQHVRSGVGCMEDICYLVVTKVSLFDSLTPGISSPVKKWGLI